MPLTTVFAEKEATVHDGIVAYYKVLVGLDIERQLWAREQRYLEQNEQTKAKEYGQIYKIVLQLFEKYNELLVNKAPKLEVLTEEELDSLKKYLEVTPLKDISTVSLVHLKYCHQTLVSEQCLTNSGSGSSSIKE